MGSWKCIVLLGYVTTQFCCGWYRKTLYNSALFILNWLGAVCTSYIYRTDVDGGQHTSHVYIALIFHLSIHHVHLFGRLFRDTIIIYVAIWNYGRNIFVYYIMWTLPFCNMWMSPFHVLVSCSYIFEWLPLSCFDHMTLLLREFLESSCLCWAVQSLLFFV